MQQKAKKVVLFFGALGLCYVVVGIIRSPQEDTRKIRRDWQERNGTWNGRYLPGDILHSSERGW